MKTSRYWRAAQAALIGLAMAARSRFARADIKDYEFQLSTRPSRPDPTRSSPCGLTNRSHRQAGTRRGDLRDTAGYGSGRHEGDGDQDHVRCREPSPAPTSSRPTSSMAGPLAAFAWRQGAGRDRHRREQVRHHGRESEPRRFHQRHRRRVVAAAGGGFVGRAQYQPTASSGIAMPAGARRRQARRSTIRTPTANRSIR